MTPNAAVKPDFVVFSARLAGPPSPVMGMGAFLKASVAVMRDGRAHLSHPIGDLGVARTRAAYNSLVPRMRAILGAVPTVIAHDLHPDFHSTRIAQGLAQEVEGVALPVQHHHAHIAAVAAENGHVGPLLGLALDGFGLGPNGDSWGGELLRVDGAGYVRLGNLRRLPQPGGDVAAREPWRMAAAVLHVLGRGEDIAGRFRTQRHARLLGQVLERRVQCPETSSAGRLFDAACGLLGVHPVADFEGQAPMALEKMVTRPRVMTRGWRIDVDGELDLLPLMRALADDVPTAPEGADLFHGTLAAALVDWVAAAADRTGLSTVGLSGGCFLNRVLTRLVSEGLGKRGLTVLTHRVVSQGDPGLALGQAWIAAHHAATLT